MDVSDYQPTGDSPNEKTWKVRLLQALAQSAISFRQSAHSEAEVWRAFGQQVTSLGMKGSLNTLDQTGQSLIPRSLSPQSPESEIDKPESPTISLAQKGPWQEVFLTRRTVFTLDENGPAFYVPLEIGNEIYGIIHLSNPDLSQDDAPAVEIFAQQVASAIEVAHLHSASAARGALRESEALFRVMTENTTSAMFIFKETGLSYANPATEQISGYSLEELALINFWDIVHPDFHEMIQKRALAQLAEESDAQPNEFKIIRKDGEERWIDFDIKIINYQGKPAGLGTAIDVTERKQVEDALIESEQKFRSIVQLSADGVALVNERGFIIEWNASLEQITGLKREEVLGEYAWDVQRQLISATQHTPESTDAAQATILTMLRTGESPQENTSSEQEIQHMDGMRRTIQFVFYPIQTKHGFMVGSVVRDITDRKQLEVTLRRRVEELASLHAVLLNITASPDLPTLLQTIIEQAARLLNAMGGGLFLCDPERQEAHLAVSFQTQKDYTGAVVKYGQGVAGKVAQTGEPLVIEEYTPGAGVVELFINEEAFRTVLSVPMFWQGRVTGVVQVFHNDYERQFNHTDLELLTLFANQAAIAVENARLLEAERRRRREAETIREAISVLTTSLNIQQVLDAILTQLEQVVPYNSASVFLRQANRLQIVAVRGFSVPDEVINSEIPSGDTLFDLVKATGRALILEDAQNDPRFHGWGNTADVRGWLAVPLVLRGEVIGYLTLDNYQVGVYNSMHAQLAETFANQAAIAIENARLFEAERAQLLLASTLQEVGALLTSKLGLEDVLENILDLLGRVVEYDSVSIQLIGQDGRLYMAAGRGFPDFQRASEIIEELSENTLKVMWEDTPVMVISDTYQNDHWMIPPDSEYIRSWVGAALLVRGKLIGCLNVDSKTVNAYDASAGETVMAFANQAAIAIENARLFEAERAAREQAEALRDAAQMISSSLSLPRVLETVLEQLARVITFDSGSVMLIHKNQAVAHAERGFENFCAPHMYEDLHLDLLENDAVGTVVRTGKPLTIPDTRVDKRWRPIPAGAHVRSWLGVPLLAREQVIGLFNLDRVLPGGFSDQEISLVMGFAIHVSTAIENARLFEAEGKRAAELEAIRQASLSLTASLELRQVLDEIVISALKLLPEANNCHIFYKPLDNDQLIFGAAYWENSLQNRPMSEPRPNGLTNTVGRTGQTIVANNMPRHALFADLHEVWNGAIVGLPLMIGQRVVGVMNIAYLQPHEFLEAELRSLRLLGDQAAIAIENARLFEQAATERRHLALLYDVGRELATTLDPDEILERATSLTCQALGSATGEAYLYLPEEEMLNLHTVHGREQSQFSFYQMQLSTPLGIGLVGWVAEHRQPANVPNVQEDPRWIHLSGVEEYIHSAMVAPILHRDRLLGVFSVLHRQPNAFSTDHVELFQAICQEVGLALSNARRYQQVQRRLAEITLIQNLAQTFNQRLELQILLDDVVTQLAHRLGYTRVKVFLVEGDQLSLKAYHGYQSAIDFFPVERAFAERVVQTGEVVFVPDVSQDALYQGNTSSVVSELAVPIYQAMQVIGVIDIESDRADQLSVQDRDLLQVLAGQISVALENAVLYEKVRQHAEELEHTVAQRTAELTELYKLSQEIGYRLSYDELLHLLLHHLRTAVNSDLVVGCLGEEECDTFWVETNRPIAQAALDDLRRYWRQMASEYDTTIQDIDKIQIEIIQAEDYSPHATPIHNITHVIYSPILLDQSVGGVLMAGSEAGRAFGAEQERLVDTFANQASTAIQRLAAILTAQQKRLEGLVERLPVGVLLLDAEFNLLVSNPLGREIFNTLTQGQDGPEFRLGAYTWQELIARHREPLPVDISLDGPPRQVFEAQARPVGDESQQWVLTVREVTQERENQARVQSQERLATVGQLAAGIAHDFNNIMATILVYADLLQQDHTLSYSSRDKLTIIQQQVQRAASLIRQILDFSRRSIMEQSSLDLLPFIKELDKLLGRIMPETIRLELTYQPGAYRLNADPTRLQQVFMNLALNSRDAMPDGGILHFELERLHLDPNQTPPILDMPPGDWVRITVTDTGIGIPEDVQQHVFEPFFTTKPVGQGTGLGLAQVYGIIKQHGGYIDLISEVGQGTSFILYLPALSTVDEAENRQASPRPMSGDGETVLVVEDDRATCAALQALLEALNYTVIIASNGKEALERYDQEKGEIALVVSDVVMPQMGGVALYKALKERWPDLKMLFITGHPMENENQSWLEKGQVHWLQKPFSVQEFTQAILALLKKPEAPSSSE